MLFRSPFLCYFLLRGGVHEKENPVIKLTKMIYRPLLVFCLNHRLPVIGLAVAALAASIAVVPQLGSEFLPELNEGSLYVTFSLPGNVSLSEARRLVPRIRERLLRTHEVADVLSQLGRPEDGTDPTLPNNLEFFLKLRPLHEWRAGAHSPYDLVPEMEKSLQEIPGLEYNFSQPIRDNVNENIAGQFGQIALKIYGDDLVELQKAAEAANDTIAAVPGASDVGIVKAGEMPQLSVLLNRPALARYDLDLEDVQDYLETAMAGHTATDIFEGERRFDVTVRMPQATREDAGAIRNLMLPLKSGALIPVSAIADVSIKTGRAAITRENGRRYVGVRMNVRNRDMGSFVATVLGRDWYYVDLEQHISMFSTANLTRFLSAHGFRLIDRRTFGRQYRLSYIERRLNDLGRENMAMRIAHLAAMPLRLAPHLHVPINLHDVVGLAAEKQ